MENYIDYLKEGSGIHIKKSHKGRFTSYCNGKVTSECIARGKRSPSAKVRKMATFAANARRWSHEEGGIIKAALGANLFLNTGRNINKNSHLTSDQYKKVIEEISNADQVQELELETPEETEKSVVVKEEKQPWTTSYRISTETTPVVTQVSNTNKPDMSRVRSDRNNNPLNIRFTNIAWQGKRTADKTDNDFEEFESRDYGWRAAYKNIDTKMKRGLNTLSKLISEWAPANENNTSGYIQYVSSKTGIDPNAIITQEDLPKIGAAMAAVESGRRDNIDWGDALRGFKFYLGQPV